jgi:PAS domain S-box-containing protein
VAEAAPVGLFAVTLAGEPVFANTALARLLGYPSVQELLQAPLSSLHPHPGLVGDILRERLEAEALDGIESALVRMDGSTIQARINARTLPLPAGGLLLVGAVEDVSAPMQAQEDLAHSQKMEAVSRFAAGVAHDYNNLLTSVLGEARQLLSEVKEGSAAHASTTAILQAARSAARLTQRLLVFARSEVVRNEPLDLSSALRGLQDHMARLLPEDVGLRWQIQDPVGTVSIPRRHLENLLANLVTNARDAMPGGGAVAVEVGRCAAPDDTDGMDYHPPVPPGDYACITVGDRGVGMNHETRRRIFDPFFTTKAPGQAAGLGLTTVHALVSRARGHIAVMSAPAYGTVVRVLLPLTPVEVPAAPPPRVDRRQAPRERPTLLVVDDDGAVRHVMVRYLARSGFEVLEAHDGMSAKEVARAHQGRIHLLVTDVMMPRIKGTELAEWMRAERPDTGILLVSGYLDSESVQAWVDRDPEVFLAKPFEPEELAVRVRRRLASLGECVHG